MPVAGRGAVSFAVPGVVRGAGAVGVFLSRGKRHDREILEWEKRRWTYREGIEKENEWVVSRVTLEQK